VRIRPFLGRLTHVSGTVPHPRGEIVVSLRRDGDALEADVRLPEGVDGEVLWRGARAAVGPGQSKVRLTRP